jgi:hypothetical protein
MGWPIGQPMNSNPAHSNRTFLSCPTTGHFYFALTSKFRADRSLKAVGIATPPQTVVARAWSQYFQAQEQVLVSGYTRFVVLEVASTTVSSSTSATIQHTISYRHQILRTFNAVVSL